MSISDYYVWESRRKNTGEALISSFAPTLRDHNVSFINGRRFPIDLPELEIKMDETSQGLLTDDLVIKKRRCLVHSQRLIECLNKVGVDNIDYYPCRIVNTVSGEVFASYMAANILDVIYCLDREKSDLEMDDEEPNEIWYIHNMQLIENRLGDAPIFRLGERKSTVLVHEKIKEQIIKDGLSGPVFLPANGYREYMGYAFNNPRNIIGTHDDDPDGSADQID